MKMKMKSSSSSKGVKRGPWTGEEDEILSKFVKKEGEGRWRTVPARAGLLRCGKSCRLRWMNYLRPCVKRGHISPDEEDLILRLHRLLGNRWSLIAGRIPGRTDNEIKNYWNTHLSKKLINQGIDPTTHKPLSIIKPISNPNNNNNLITIKQPALPQSPQHIINNDNPTTTTTTTTISASADDHHHLNLSYCSSDDLFSSFLDSLINDDDAFPAIHPHIINNNNPFL